MYKITVIFKQKKFKKKHTLTNLKKKKEGY